MLQISFVFNSFFLAKLAESPLHLVVLDEIKKKYFITERHIKGYKFLAEIVLLCFVNYDK
jgi:hypothetical protein